MRNKLLNTLLALLLSTSVFAVDEAYYKEVRRSVNVNSNVRFNIDINFADITVNTWEQNSIEIVVKMDVTARDESRANELFEAFDVNITEGKDVTSLTVNAGNGGCNNNGKNSENYKVTVEVKMPLSAVLDGRCAFGDMTISDMKGACELNIEYGDLRANGLWSYENDIRIAFGSAKINGSNGGEFQNEYGDLDIGLLQGNSEIHSSFGDLEIDRVTKECKDLEVKVEYADADINFAQNAGFRFEANSSYGDIDLPDSFKKTTVESDYTSKEIKGSFGSGEGKLEIECDFGDVDIDITSN
jgi:hypothetical protein